MSQPYQRRNSVSAKPGTSVRGTVSKTIGQSSPLASGHRQTLFSGLDSQRVGKAKQLFLTNTVLMEWSRVADFGVGLE
jgi:hypothetical protein